VAVVPWARTLPSMTGARRTTRDPARTDARRRADLKDRLWGEGVTDDLAETWIARWEAEAVARGIPRDAAFWRMAAGWIDRERGAD